MIYRYSVELQVRLYCKVIQFISCFSVYFVIVNALGITEGLTDTWYAVRNWYCYVLPSQIFSTPKRRWRMTGTTRYLPTPLAAVQGTPPLPMKPPSRHVWRAIKSWQTIRQRRKQTIWTTVRTVSFFIGFAIYTLSVRLPSYQYKSMSKLGVQSPIIGYRGRGLYFYISLLLTVRYLTREHTYIYTCSKLWPELISLVDKNIARDTCIPLIPGLGPNLYTSTAFQIQITQQKSRLQRRNHAPKYAAPFRPPGVVSISDFDKL